MISIIIPAYNEEKVIERCLSAIFSGVTDNEVEVIVSCNGCKDFTAEKARNFNRKVIVLETEKASKTVALNAADKIAKFFPRFYIDADVLIEIGSIRKIVEALENSNALLASPIADSVTSYSNTAVKAFYDIWLSLPYNKVMVGTGVYVLTEAGRRRFDEFPAVIADDGFVRSLFQPAERVAVQEAIVKVFAPKTLKELVKVKTRSRLGNYELKQRFPEIKNNDEMTLLDVLKAIPINSDLPYKLLIYLYINIVSRFRAKMKLKKMVVYIWERDDSARY